ncbi:hypothetical protein B0H12DRAFT_1132642 [Mycena haematopus]|nr:hypothetical protein B0H12DRAFT_1132642 [Mycena haematopus]
MFGKPGACPEDGEELLECLLLPRLEAIRTDLSGSTLLAFLKESSPPLQELVLRPHGAIDFVALAEYVPDLTHFEMWYPQYLAVENLFAVLAEFQSPFSHLRTLVVHAPGDTPENPVSFWTALIRALAARRTQIQIFRLTVPDMIPPMMPSPDILAAIRELAVDGMQVCIIDTRYGIYWTDEDALEQLARMPHAISA